MNKPFILAILDGWGLGEPREGNAIFKARTPNFEHIENTYPSLSLQASGIAVGLMWGEAGNSEVGHLSIGAGRVIYQTLPRILLSIRDESFFANPVFLAAAERAKKNNSALHLLGMVSSGSVHSYIDHLYALLEFCNRQKLEKVFLHIITDGRDSSPQEAGKFIGQLRLRLEATSKAKIASIGGRHFIMDRDGNWDRIKKAYDCLVEGKGVLIKDPVQYLKDAYAGGGDDQH
ncbi:MAG: 2,3-bisphosphoglycerate-independent phosphoglycerate mutase, partial [Patescibacteria group bacterium]